LINQSSPHQNLDVSRHRLQRDVEWSRQLGHELRFLVESLQDFPPDRIGESEEDLIHKIFLGTASTGIDQPPYG
jgi:hypothetical protein